MNAAQIANGVTIRTMQSMTSGHHGGGGGVLAWVALVFTIVLLGCFLYCLWKGGK